MRDDKIYPTPQTMPSHKQFHSFSSCVFVAVYQMYSCNGQVIVEVEMDGGAVLVDLHAEFDHFFPLIGDVILF